MKYLSEEAAVETLKQIFSQTNTDSISPKEASLAWGRETYSDEENRRWFDNKMTHLKHHILVKPVYTRRNSRRVLDKIQLTLGGKRALEKIENDEELDTPSANRSGNLSISDAMNIVSRLRKENPEYQITFDVRLKEEQ